jgi:hypothetical protein
MVYAVLVAVAAYGWQFWLFKPNALVWSLFLLTPLVPLLDRWRPAASHQWRAPRAATHQAGLVPPAPA